LTPTATDTPTPLPTSPPGAAIRIALSSTVAGNTVGTSQSNGIRVPASTLLGPGAKGDLFFTTNVPDIPCEPLRFTLTNNGAEMSFTAVGPAFLDPGTPESVAFVTNRQCNDTAAGDQCLLFAGGGSLTFDLVFTHASQKANGLLTIPTSVGNVTLDVNGGSLSPAPVCGVGALQSHAVGISPLPQ